MFQTCTDITKNLHWEYDTKLDLGFKNYINLRMIDLKFLICNAYSSKFANQVLKFWKIAPNKRHKNRKQKTGYTCRSLSQDLEVGEEKKSVYVT